jgi:WD40 repeat protein
LDVRTGRVKFKLVCGGIFRNPIAYSPDGLTLVTGGEGKSVKLWDTQTGTLKQTLMGHDQEVSRVAYSPDGTMIVSGSPQPHYRTSAGWELGWNSSLRVWDANTGKLKARKLLPLWHNSDLTFTPDSSTIIYDEDGLKKWRIR